MVINVKKVNPQAKLPIYSSLFAAGADLYACLTEDVTIQPSTSVFIPCGFAMAIPQGYVGLVYARSGLACRQGLAPSNKVGVIDSDYRGEIIVSLFNQSQEARVIRPFDRIAQLVIAPVEQADFCEVEDLDKTQRGEGGFGSTGVR